MPKKSITSDQVHMVLRKGKKYPVQHAILRTDVPQPKPILYKDSEMRKSVQQMKEKPRAIKVTGGSVSTREPLSKSSKRAGSMTKSGLPRTSKRTDAKPVAMPSKPGNIATGSKKTARVTRPGGRPKNGIPDLKSKKLLKPMTEAQKQAKALDALEKKRASVAKKTGKRPNYYTN
jgi:hypothetical protein